jgi:hypothetical protein
MEEFIMKYRKKQIVIEAIQWTGFNLDEIKDFVGKALHIDINHSLYADPSSTINLTIATLEGDHICTKGDFIIKGVNGEFYPCKPDIFEKTYELVE